MPTNTIDLNAKIADLSSHASRANLFKHLEVFVKIADAGSFSEAAERIGVTPSAVSRSLSKLETEVGATLIKRTTRSLVLTDSGHYLYRQTVHLLSELDYALNEVGGYHSHPQGQLKVTCSIAFASTHLMGLFNEYRKKYPDVRLLVDLTDQFVNLNESDIDLALRITYSPPQNYAIRKICPIHWAYCATPEYLHQHGEPKKLKDLEAHRCLVYPRISDAWQYIDENRELRALNIKPEIEANSSLVLLQAALMDQGIVHLPTYVLGNHIRSGELKPLLMDERINFHEYFLYALYFPSRFHMPKIRTFIDFILEKLAPQAPWDYWMQGDEKKE